MIQTVLEYLHFLTTPEGLRHLIGDVFPGWAIYGVLCAIVFSETGLLVGFFLPGDSLLFTVGVVAGDGALNIGLVIAFLAVAVMLGDSTGYFLGRRTGPAIFNRPDSRFFKREHFMRTKEFYEKHGGRTIFYARFVPIVRTFTAFVAGVAEMPYSRFLPYSICAAIFWVAALTLLGYEIGSIPFVRKYFDKLILLIIAVSLLPAILEVLKARRAHSTSPNRPAA